MSDAKELDNLPLEAGTYNVMVEGVMTFAPLFLNFDGKQWEIWKDLKKKCAIILTKKYIILSQSQ